MAAPDDLNLHGGKQPPKLHGGLFSMLIALNIAFPCMPVDEAWKSLAEDGRMLLSNIGRVPHVASQRLHAKAKL